jgi:hypothetical protein
MDPLVNASAGMSASRMLAAGLGVELPDPTTAFKLLLKTAKEGAHGAARLRWVEQEAWQPVKQMCPSSSPRGSPSLVVG